LQWVGCGHRPGSLPFLELVSSYDKFSWGLILPTLLVFPMVYTGMEVASFLTSPKIKSFRFPLKLFLYQNIVGFSKVLVDQGPDEMSPKFLARLPLRILMGFYLLMAIILSNGYKGENITKLISPIAPLPFQTLDELAAEKYVVESIPIVKPHWSNLTKPNKEFWTNVFPYYLEKNGIKNWKSNGFHSYDISGFWNLTQKTFRIKGESQILDYLTQAGSKMTQQEEFILNNSRLSFAFQPRGRKLERWITRLGLSQMYNCSNNRKIAIITYKENIQRFHTIYLKKHTKNQQKNNGKNWPLSFGKDVLASGIRGINFVNWVSPKIPMRIGALYTSGIVTWLDKFNETIYKEMGLLVDLPSINTFKATTMMGSFSVVFFILAFGGVASILAFFFEMNIFISYLWTFVHFVLNRLNKKASVNTCKM